MSLGWRRRPGDRVVRVRHHPYRLRRVLGIPALYSAGYGNVGSSIYYALGVVAVAAMGATPIALAAAGVFFVFTAMTYAEGTALFPEAGGSASFARHAFNDMVGFLAGWGLMLSYVVTIAISAFVIPPYLGYFWEPLKDDTFIGTTFSMGLIFLLMLLNIFGVKETAFMNILAATMDLLIQFVIVVLGFVFLLNPNQLIEQMRLNWPSPQNLILGIALATMAYTGVETISQMAEEARRPRFRVPRALMLMVATVLVMFFGISLVAFSTMTPQELVSQWAKDPVAGIAQHLPEQLASMTFTDPAVDLLFKRFSDILTSVLPAVVALLAATILLLATNAGLMGISRLAFSLGKNQQLPDAFCRVHRKFKTPYLSLIVFTLIALLLLIPALFSSGFLLTLGALYTFSALVINALAHLSVIALRVKYPNLQRPFKLPFSFRVAGREIPPTAVLGLLISLSIWLMILYYQPVSRWAGLGWMGLGLVVYIIHRWRKGLPLSSPPPGRPL